VLPKIFNRQLGRRQAPLVASRAQWAAAAGEIRVTQGVYERVQSELAGSRAQKFQLKGFEAPTTLYAA
jgi:class 3 adenylate cyclase